MLWIKSGIENPSKSGVIGRFGGDEKPEWPRRTDKSRTLKKTWKKHTAFVLLWLRFMALLYNVCLGLEECELFDQHRIRNTLIWRELMLEVTEIKQVR